MPTASALPDISSKPLKAQPQLLKLGHPAFDLAAFKALFRQYEASLEIALDFQDFEAELAQLPGRYSPERGGQCYLLCAEMNGQLQAVGCAAHYALALPQRHEHPVAELKRFFLRPEARGLKLGIFLLQAVINEVKQQGYDWLYLDSLERLGPAKTLYERFGFEATDPYNVNPYPDVYYKRLAL